jgi:Cu2+-exporting ATPase
MVKDVDAVVFDKTGTLTHGRFGITEVVSFIPEDELLKLSSSVEVNSEHIIAKAIVEHTIEKGIDIPQVIEFKAIPGKGAYGLVDGREVYIGGAKPP